MRKVAYFFAVAVVLCLIVTGAVCLRSQQRHAGTSFNHGANAVWLGVEWVNEPHSDAELVALANDLASQEIRYIFVFASYRRFDGSFGASYAQAGAFIRVLKTAQPELNIQAWVGLPLSQSTFPWSKRGRIRLDETTRSEIVAFCAGLMQQGFDGLHLDPEPALSGDGELLMLLDQLRVAIGPDKLLSIATPRIEPYHFPGQTAWDSSYYREVAERVNQVAVMTYDSALPLPGLYRWWIRTQTVAISKSLSATGVDLFIGIPTSEEWTSTHWPKAENVANGLQGVLDGLSGQTEEVIKGVAIYPYWEMQEGEWAIYESLWLGRQELFKT